MEEEDVVETGGCAARADRRVGEGIARPRPVFNGIEHLLCAGDLFVTLVLSGSRTSRDGTATVVWRWVV
jgi:hypothetical protein